MKFITTGNDENHMFVHKLVHSEVLICKLEQQTVIRRKNN